MYSNLPQYAGVYPRYENPTMEHYRRRQDVRFLCQSGKYDVYVSTNYTHLYGVYGEEEEQYIPAFIPFADSYNSPWITEAVNKLKKWGYL